MTLTSTGPSGFHIRPIVTVLAVVAFVAGVYAISQQILTDTQPSTPAATEAVAETAEPYTGPSGLSEAYAAGKLDAGLNPTLSEPFVGTTPAPETVVIAGQGSLYDALIEGKYDVDFLSGASGRNMFSFLRRQPVRADRPKRSPRASSMPGWSRNRVRRLLRVSLLLRSL